MHTYLEATPLIVLLGAGDFELRVHDFLPFEEELLVPLLASKRSWRSALASAILVNVLRASDKFFPIPEAHPVKNTEKINAKTRLWIRMALLHLFLVLVRYHRH